MALEVAMFVIGFATFIVTSNAQTISNDKGCGDNSTCYSWEICDETIGECVYRNCGNSGGDAYCWSQGYGPEYVCYEPNYDWNPNYAYCRQMRCNSTLDCETDIGPGYVCDDDNGYYETGECTEGCKNDTSCSNLWPHGSYVCDATTSLCEYECTNSTQCQYYQSSNSICNETTSRCETVPWCAIEGCDYTKRYGYETYCDWDYGYCRQSRCWSESDCGDDFYCTYNGGSYEGYCYTDCNTQNETYCQDQYYSDYQCQSNGACEQLGCDGTAECISALGDGWYCTDNYGGSCRESCVNDTSCRSWEFCDDTTGECVEENCGNQGGDSYCQEQGYGPEYVCYEPDWDPDYAYCRQMRCNSTLDCQDNIGSGWVCDNAGGSWEGECTEGCKNDTSCYWDFWPYGSHVCDTTTLLCEFRCNATTECSNYFGANYECNNNRCEEIPWCVYHDGICDQYSQSYGAEFTCNVTTGNCNLVKCTMDSSCSNAPFTTCYNPWADVLDDPGYCIDPCTSDQECRNRNYNDTNYYCILGFGICYYANSCQSDSDCWSDEICEDALCKQFYCESDEECIDYIDNSAATCGEYGVCRDHECLDASDCTHPENACFTYLTNVTWGWNICYTTCIDDSDCSAAYPNNNEFTCEVLKTGSIQDNIPPMDISICTNATLPTLSPTTTETPDECSCNLLTLIDTPFNGGDSCYRYQVNFCNDNYDTIEIQRNQECNTRIKSVFKRFRSTKSGSGITYEIGTPSKPGITISGLSDGDVFTLCFDSSKVEDVRQYGFIDFSNPRGRQTTCRVMDTLFNLCGVGDPSFSAYVVPANNGLKFVDNAIASKDNETSTILMQYIWTVGISGSASMIVVFIVYISCIKRSRNVEVYEKVVNNDDEEDITQTNK